MANYTDLQQAKEAIGGHKRCVLEIDLIDNEGHRPEGWSRTLTLYLCKDEPFLRDSTATSFRWYEPLVKSFGRATDEAFVGTGLSVTSDNQFVLKNAKVMFQEDNSIYTFSSGTPGLTPEPVGDQVKLSELFQFYTWMGQDLRGKVLFFSTGDTDQNVAGSWLEDEWFSGQIESLDIGDEIVVDATLTKELESSELPGRVLSESIEPQARTQRMPIVAGNFNEMLNYFGTPEEDHGMGIPETINSGLLKPQAHPTVPWKRPEDDEERWYLAYSDLKGRNPNWTDQDRLGAAGYYTTNDQAYVFHQQQGLVTRLLRDDVGPPAADGQVAWETKGVKDTELLLDVGRYLSGDVMIPCYEIASESGDSIINPAYMFDGDVDTFASLPLHTTGTTLKCNIRPVQRLGQMESIHAYVMVVGSDHATINANAKVNFHMSYGKQDGSSDEPNQVVGWYVRCNNEIVGKITPSGQKFTAGRYHQRDNVEVGTSPQLSFNRDILKSSSFWWTDDHCGSDSGDNGQITTPTGREFVTFNGPPDSILNWDWTGCRGVYEIGHGLVVGEDVGNLQVQISVTSPGDVGNTLQIAQCGVIVRYRYQLGPPTLWRRQPYEEAIYINNVSSNARTGTVKGVRQVPTDTTPITDGVWITNRRTSLDNTGDLTGFSGNPVQTPSDIMAWLMLKWGNGAPAVNTSSSPITSGANFGSFWWAEATWKQDYAPDTLSLEAQLIVTAPTTLKAVLDDMCSQYPIGIHRKHDGTVYAFTYTDSGTDYNAYYSDGGLVQFHPNTSHPSADRFGRPFVAWDFKVSLTPRSEIFNRFRLKYWKHGPSGELLKQYVVTEVASESNVYNDSTNMNDGDVNDLVTAIGYNASDACRASQLNYDVINPLEVSCPTINTHHTAMAALNYLMTRFLNPRIIVEFTVGTEAYDLLPGHRIKLSRDWNVHLPKPDYPTQAAKNAGWDAGDDSWFLVQRVQKIPGANGISVRVKAEQIISTVLEGNPLKVNADAVLTDNPIDLTVGADAFVGVFTKTVSADAVLINSWDLTVVADAKLI